MNGVSVSEEEPSAFRNFCASGHGVVFAGPIFWKDGSGDDGDCWTGVDARRYMGC
jgi:hypothetical protein